MTVQWIGSGATSSWNDAGNWSGSTVPHANVRLGPVGPSMPDGGALAVGSGATPTTGTAVDLNNRVLVLQTNTCSVSTAITSLSLNDGIGIEQGDSSSMVQHYRNSCYAPVVFTHVAPGSGATASRIAFRVSGSETIVTGACFLAGTRIATDHGDVAIEQLAEGDRVVTLHGNDRRLGSIRSLERADIDLTGLDETSAREALPIRIRAHAFAANVPTRDLLITPDHCILVDGGLIPARMLVNDASIVRDSSLRHYTMHRLHCEQEAILLSNGLTTESRAVAAAAPATLRSAVEPIRRRLLARAEQLGLVAPPAAKAIGLREPALRLRLDDGTVLRARRRTGERHFFEVPAGTDHAVLLSRRNASAEVAGRFVDDRRLGVLVQSAILWMELRSTAIPLAASWLQGRHAADHPGQPDWTDGEAEITFDAVSRATVLELTLAGGMSAK